MLLWMAVPGVIGTAPTFAIFATVRRALELSSDSMSLYFYLYFWLIVPGTTGIYNILLMHNMFKSIPMEIVESARSDGASNMKIFRRIIIPLAKPTIMLIVMFTFIGSWNNLVWPQLTIQPENSKWYTITLGLSGYASESNWSAVAVAMASSVFSLLPVIIVFLITQNKVLDGFVTSGIKG